MVGVYAYLTGPIWGNTVEHLLDQEELWRVLGFEARFAGIKDKPQTDLLDFSDELYEFELSKGAVELLKLYLARPSQTARMGLLGAVAIRRMGQ
jgi:hypothetical protein